MVLGRSDQQLLGLVRIGATETVVHMSGWSGAGSAMP